MRKCAQTIGRRSGIAAGIGDGIEASAKVHYRSLVIGRQTNARTMEPSCHVVTRRELASAASDYCMDAIGLGHCGSTTTVTQIDSSILGACIATAEVCSKVDLGACLLRQASLGYGA